MHAILSGGRRRALGLALATAAVLSVSADPAAAASCPAGAAAVHVDSYRLTGTAGIRTVTDLTGKVNQGDAIDQVTFTVNASCTAGVSVTLVAYSAPGPRWDPATASRQTVFDSQGSTFGPGQNTLSPVPVAVPPGCFQVDLVRGAVIQQFNPPTGTYSAQGRLVDADSGDPGCVPLV